MSKQTVIYNFDLLVARRVLSPGAQGTGSEAASQIQAVSTRSRECVTVFGVITEEEDTATVIGDRGMFIPDSLRSCMIETDVTSYLQTPSSGQVLVLFCYQPAETHII
uniref:Uncharacterized protein n=1 Tax=Lutzomyia longipalpis TaxID=7200 RepID=A0A1B0C994_LUTLO